MPLVYTLGVKGRVGVYDVLGDELDPKLVNLGKSLGRGGYGTFQDGYLIAGFSGNVGKLNGKTLEIEGKILDENKPEGKADLDFANAVGNLIFLGDDHKQGSFIIPHSTSPDNKSPEVNWVQPQTGDKNIAPTSCVGVSFTDQLDVKSIGPSTFALRPVDGEPLTGQYSYNFNVANFCPDTPLEPNTTYEIVVHKGGLIDMSQNAFNQDFVSAFSTGEKVDVPTSIHPYQIREKKGSAGVPHILINGKTTGEPSGKTGSFRSIRFSHPRE